MSKISDMIKEMCPNGVEYTELKNVINYQRGKGLSKKEKSTGHNPIILYGELYTTYGNYITEIVSFASNTAVKSATCVKKGSLLLPISSTTKEAQIGRAAVLKCSDAYLGGDAISLYPHNNIDSDFLMYFINSITFEKEKMKCVRGTTIQHLDPNKLLKIKVPVPPLEVQREIVHYLDQFTLLTAELTAELEMRKKQYNFYRDTLLNFDRFSVDCIEDTKEAILNRSITLSGVEEWLWKLIEEYAPNGVEYKKIGDVSKVLNGFAFQSNNLSNNGKYGICKTTNIQDGLISEDKMQWTNLLPADNYAIKPNTTVIGLSGTIKAGKNNTNKIYYLNQRVAQFKPFAINNDYLYFIVMYSIPKLTHLLTGGSVKNLSTKTIENLDIPVPPLPIQEAIVKVLDEFNALTTSIETGIPAEIETRQKQYEYYRNELLTFEAA